jgi:hypothetical protein
MERVLLTQLFETFETFDVDVLIVYKIDRHVNFHLLYREWHMPES